MTDLERQFSLAEITGCLDDLGISYETVGAASASSFTPASLLNIIPGGVYFSLDDRYLGLGIANSVIFTADAGAIGDGNLLIVTDAPQLNYYKFLRHFYAERPQPGIHPTAIIDPRAEIDAGAYIGPFCVVEQARIEAGVRLHSSVTVMRGSVLERDVNIEPHSVIGATGVVWSWDAEAGERVVAPQIGRTIVREGCFLGSDVSVVRASINEATEIGRFTVIAHGSKIGHGTQMGDECHLANNVSIGGGVVIGRRSFLSSGCSLRPGVQIGPKTVVGAGSTVVKNYPDGGQTLMGIPAVPRAKEKTTRMAGVPDLKGMEK